MTNIGDGIRARLALPIGKVAQTTARERPHALLFGVSQEASAARRALHGAVLLDTNEHHPLKQ